MKVRRERNNDTIKRQVVR